MGKFGVYGFFFVMINISCWPSRWQFGIVGNEVGQINEVAIWRARLVLGRVTVQLQVWEIYLAVTNHPG